MSRRRSSTYERLHTNSFKYRLRCPICRLDMLLARARVDAMLAELWRPDSRETRKVIV